MKLRPTSRQQFLPKVVQFLLALKLRLSGSMMIPISTLVCMLMVDPALLVEQVALPISLSLLIAEQLMFVASTDDHNRKLNEIYLIHLNKCLYLVII